ncbi:MAG TPA: hypothetical protein VF631_03490 [Allosphingosinicella sp.]|jgi:hypothetical protein|uniref:hypothetical protein n=1 Tax=Allosphingosinicella sp. TaxID=2823234 RepID=UPI002F287EA1
MTRSVKDFIDIKNPGTLDELIARLIEIRDGLPAGREAEVRMRGDDVFGRKLSISFQRPQTAEEAECDARYADAYRASREREQSRIADERGATGHAPRNRGRRLRMVA